MNTLFLCGDVMTGRGVDQVLPHPSVPELREPWVHDARDYVRLVERASGPVPRRVDPAYVWGESIGELRRATLRIVNLETSITAYDDFWPDKGINYRMHPVNTGVLTAARLDLCVLANNHVLDFGRDGLVETLTTLHAHGIRTVGAGRDREEAERPAELPLGDGRLLVYAVAGMDSGVPAEWEASAQPGVCVVHGFGEATADALLSRIERRPGDVVMVSVHWGGNWGYDVPEPHVRFARRLVDGGVDLVHGHSSHHPKPLEVYRGRLILYGCGDFVNDYEGISGHESYRPDLVCSYLPTLAGDGALAGLELVPMRLHRFALRRASVADAAWLAARLTGVSAAFGARLSVGERGRLRLT